MARTHYTDSQKVAFVKAWLESNQPKSRWHREQVAAGNLEGHYNAFSQWIEKYENGELVGSGAVATERQQAALRATVAHFAPAASAKTIGSNASLMAEFQQSLLPEDVQARYIAFLEQKVTSLTSELEAVQAENTALESELAALKMPEPESE